MTRLQAIKYIRAGGTLIKLFEANRYGIEDNLEVWLRHQDICDFDRVKRIEHDTIGSVHLRLCSEGGKPNWLHITPMQVLHFLKRNYGR
jgi:hypothetical protein